MSQTIQIEQMQATIFETSAALGQAAARDFAAVMAHAVQQEGEAAVILATGNSQLPFIEALSNDRALRDTVPWERITVFHMDEYLGIGEDHPASFRRFIRERIQNVFRPRAVHLLAGDATDIEAECVRYAALLEAHNPVLCVLGIGENGHLAFNDPPADFTTARLVHVVTLDTVCRRQQVGEGHFASLEDVPKQAVTLTVPALLKPRHVMALVPEARKAPAVRAALEGPFTESCPASILRTQPHVRLYLDHESASLLTHYHQE